MFSFLMFKLLWMIGRPLAQVAGIATCCPQLATRRDSHRSSNLHANRSGSAGCVLYQVCIALLREPDGLTPIPQMPPANAQRLNNVHLEARLPVAWAHKTHCRQPAHAFLRKCQQEA